MSELIEKLRHAGNIGFFGIYITYGLSTDPALLIKELYDQIKINREAMCDLLGREIVTDITDFWIKSKYP